MKQQDIPVWSTCKYSVTFWEYLCQWTSKKILLE
jgi:hypothetical protein